MIDNGREYCKEFHWVRVDARIEGYMVAGEGPVVEVELVSTTECAPIMSSKHAREFAMALLKAADTAERGGG